MRRLAWLVLLLSVHQATPAGGAAADGASKRISEQKCEEYLEQASQVLTYVPLTVNSQPVSIKLADCDPSSVHLIVGGSEAKLGEFPHMAALGYYGDSTAEPEWLCGGSLISERYVLTAAHCIGHDRYGSPRVVRLGEHDLTTTTEGARPQDFRVLRSILHPDYRPNRKYHDIALLKLTTDVTFSKTIRPACLREKVPAEGDKLTATGWGRVQYAAEQSPKLLKVVLPVVGAGTCSELWASTIRASNSSLPRGIDHEVMLCAGDLGGGKDTCLGDSGGPLSERSDSKPCLSYVVGVTSFGRFCGWQNSPGIYTRVSHYLSWIESVVWPEGAVVRPTRPAVRPPPTAPPQGFVRPVTSSGSFSRPQTTPRPFNRPETTERPQGVSWGEANTRPDDLDRPDTPVPTRETVIWPDRSGRQRGLQRRLP